MKIGGLKLDVYDLTVEDLAEVRPLLEKAALLDAKLTPPDEIAKLADHQFGLIGITKKGQIVRRFPLHDKDNVKLALLFFVKNADRLPYDVFEKVALRIHGALRDHGLCTPGFSNVLESVTPEKVAEARAAGPIDLEHCDDVPVKIARQAKPGANDYAVVVERPDGEKVGLYYVGTPDALRDAVREFEDNGWRGLTPELRVKVADGLAARLSGKKLPEKIASYASDSLSPDLRCWLDARKGLAPDGRAALDGLWEKRAEFTGRSLGRALEAFDRMQGLDRYWDSDLPDPFMSCYAAPAEKTAKLNGAELSESEILRLAKSAKVASIIGTEVALALQADPVDVFTSLPNPTKELLAGMAAEA